MFSVGGTSNFESRDSKKRGEIYLASFRRSFSSNAVFYTFYGTLSVFESVVMWEFVFQGEAVGGMAGSGEGGRQWQDCWSSGKLLTLIHAVV